LLNGQAGLALLLTLSAIVTFAVPGRTEERPDAARNSTGNSSVVTEGSASTTIPPAVESQIKTLWDLSEARKVPFDVEVLSTRTDDGYRTDEMYLTSRMTPDGPDRIFCTFARPIATSPSQPAYVDLTGGRPIEGVTWLAKHYRCAVLDIEWRNPGLKHQTKWSRPSPNGLFGLNPTLTDDFNCMFVTGIRRAIDFLVAQPGIDPTRIACGGGSMGGWYSMLVAGIDSRVACVNDAWAAGRDVAGTVQTLPADKREIWRTAFDPLTYAGNNRAATLMYLGANDYFFPPNNGMEHYNLIRAEKRMLILPNCNHGFGSFGVALPDIDRNWIDFCFHAGAAFPTLSDPSARGRKYRWKTAGPSAIKSSVLYWSPGTPVWQARYWVGIPAERHGSAWTAEIPAEYAGLAGAVYASAFDENGNGVSSRIVSRKGADPNTAGCPTWPGQTLWDTERGASAWRRPGPAAEYALWAEDATFVSPCGISVTPMDPAGKVAVLTNSVILASGHASEYTGIRLIINGGGTPGDLTVDLEKDSGIPVHSAHITHKAHIHYGPDSTTANIPWSDFVSSDKTPSTPYPFDGLRIDGDREKGRTLTLERIEMYR
jgi:cephalosporin-C deacetylase-like acetyl esterase